MDPELKELLTKIVNELQTMNRAIDHIEVNTCYTAGLDCDSSTTNDRLKEISETVNKIFLKE